MSERLRVGISTCPNDTFAFHGLLTGAVGARGLELEFELADVETLNERFLAGELDAAKCSFHAALRAPKEHWVLPAGSALGFGVGPVLLSSEARALPAPGAEEEPRVLCPGAWTTASLLYRILHPRVGRIEQVVFSSILPALAARRADFGVCIHEGRFTFREHGLHLVEDLGASWEARHGLPLPLGGILARRSLGLARARALALAIGDSIDHARARPAAALATMRAHAQEQRDEVLWAHVELYVNSWTRALGAQGARALSALERAARGAGLFAEREGRLEVLDLRLFHLLPAHSWRAHLAGGEPAYQPPSLAREGFVHLSFAEQLEGSLQLHFAGERELVLLELDPVRAAPALVLEPARGGALFPHLRRPIEPEDLLGARPLSLGMP